MIVPCIDLMGGKVVQLKQGREKVLEGRPPREMLELFAGFPQIQVIDLDAAMGKGSNSDIVESLASRAALRVGGGVRSPQRAEELVRQGAFRVIVGTAAFAADGPNHSLLEQIRNAIGSERVIIALDSKAGRVVVQGWQAATNWVAADVMSGFEPYCSGFLCTYVDKEGMMEGTNLEWFADLRAATSHEITAAGGLTTLEDDQALTRLQVHCSH